jgi:UDP-N-acetylmuramate dehydrogenase
VGDVPPNLRKRLRSMQSEGGIQFHERVDLREWTTLRVGGPADLMIRCRFAAAVQDVVDLLASHGIRWIVLGAGSRLVVPDAGVRVPVLILIGDLARWEVDLDGLIAGAGAKLTQVGGSVARAGLSGMERLFGAPGSVGGAVCSALAGAGGDITSLLEWIDIVSPGKSGARVGLGTFERDAFDTIERERRSVVVRARFGLRGDQLSAIHARIAAVEQDTGGWRTRCAAPVFAAPAGENVDELIRESGCRGLQVGAAQVSTQLANAITTGRVATTEDVMGLCRRVVSRVEDSCGVTLQTRLCFIDEHGLGVEP